MNASLLRGHDQFDTMQSKAKQRCVMGLYAQLQTKNTIHSAKVQL